MGILNGGVVLLGEAVVKLSRPASPSWPSRRDRSACCGRFMYVRGIAHRAITARRIASVNLCRVIGLQSASAMSLALDIAMSQQRQHREARRHRRRRRRAKKAAALGLFSKALSSSLTPACRSRLRGGQLRGQPASAAASVKSSCRNRRARLPAEPLTHRRHATRCGHARNEKYKRLPPSSRRRGLSI